jgi:uncharacterized protein (DUF1697 family)
MGGMTRYVAFLRAINVGGRRVAMADLRRHVEALGYADVSTHIASGNVIFEAPGRADGLETAIEAKLGEVLGFEVETFVRSRAQLAEVVAAEPFPQRRDGDTHLVAFIRKRPSAAVQRAVEALASDVDTLVVDGTEIHWLINGKTMDSKIKPTAWTKAVDGPTTTRNITMLRKLAAKLEA